MEVRERKEVGCGIVSFWEECQKVEILKILTKMWSESRCILQLSKEVGFRETVVEMEGRHGKQGNKERVWLGKLIVVYFDLAYYLGLSPFRIKERGQKGEFDIASWWLPKARYIKTI